MKKVLVAVLLSFAAGVQAADSTSMSPTNDVTAQNTSGGVMTGPQLFQATKGLKTSTEAVSGNVYFVNPNGQLQVSQPSFGNNAFTNICDISQGTCIVNGGGPYNAQVYSPIRTYSLSQSGLSYFVQGNEAIGVAKSVMWK